MDTFGTQPGDMEQPGVAALDGLALPPGPGRCARKVGPGSS